MESDTVEASDVDELKDRYTVEGDTAFYKVKGVDRSVKLSELDKMFYSYSKFGENLSQDEMIRRFNFPRSYWGGLKAVFNLSKNSNTFSEITGKTLTPIEYRERVQASFDSRNENVEDVIKRQYESSLIKGYEKMTHSYAKHKVGSDTFLNELSRLMPERKTLIQNVVPKEKCKLEWLLANVADLHIGLKVEGLKMTPNYNIGVVKKRLALVAENINSYCAESVELPILGDMLESFTGMNHATTFKNMEGVYDANLVFVAYDILIDFFNKINNLKKVYIISGNHDRATPNKDHDPNGSIGLIIGEMIKRFCGGKFEVECHNLYIDARIGGNQFLLTHGDKNTFRASGDGKKAKSKSLLHILDYVDTNAKKTVIIEGHKHAPRVQNLPASSYLYGSASDYKWC